MPPELNVSTENTRSSPSKWTLPAVALVLIAVVVAALGAFAWKLDLISFGESQEYSTENTPFDVLLQNNVAFVEANTLYINGQYTEAIQKYQVALALARDSIQEGQIKIKIAHATRDSGDITTAIQLYKEIAANPTYESINRAYAVLNLGFIVFDPTLVSYRSAVFSGEPYAAMMEEADVSLAYRRLFEYASSLYPLAFSEFYSANWYASEILRTQDASTHEPYLEIIRTKITNGENDLRRIVVDENEQVIVPEVYKWRATLYGNLSILGEVTVEQAKQAFEGAMRAQAALGPVADGYTRFFFAEYLGRVSNISIDEVRAVLAPFYTDSEYVDSSALNFFASEKNDQFGYKVTLQNLARIDFQFKDLLVSLGWKDSDFK